VAQEPRLHYHLKPRVIRKLTDQLRPEKHLNDLVLTVKSSEAGFLRLFGDHGAAQAAFDVYFWANKRDDNQRIANLPPHVRSFFI
jgi:hypothetical protein